MKKKILAIGAVAALSGFIAAAPGKTADAKSDQGARLSEVVAYNKEGKKKLTYSIDYDKDGRVSAVKATRPEDVKGGFFAEDEYKYDDDGRIATIEATNLNPGKTTLTYDKDGKVSQVRHPDAFKIDEKGKISGTQKVYTNVEYKDGKTVIKSGLLPGDKTYTRTYKDGVLSSEDVMIGKAKAGTVTYTYNDKGYIDKIESTIPHYDMVAMKPISTSKTDYTYEYEDKFGENVPTKVKAGDYTYTLNYEQGKNIDEQQKTLLGRDVGYGGLYSVIAYDDSQLCGFDITNVPTVVYKKMPV